MIELNCCFYRKSRLTAGFLFIHGLHGLKCGLHGWKADGRELMERKRGEGGFANRAEGGFANRAEGGFANRAEGGERRAEDD
jgi:hypothetical protein